MAKGKPVKITVLPDDPKEKLPLFQYSLNSKEFTEEMKNFPPVYFDKRNGSYWFRPNGEWLSLGARELSLHLQMRGLTKTQVWGMNGLRQIDWPLYNASQNNAVSYAGPLAGHRAGTVRDTIGKSWLVTEEPPLDVWGPLPQKGEPEFFKKFVQELLPEDQWLHFCYWLSIGLASLRRCDFQPGQACILAGPAQCGKSLMQTIITLVLGGRSAKPFKYMTGEAKFNIELIKAEHWMIEDPPTTTDLKSRRIFGERLKECCNNREFEALQKNKDAEIVAIFRRVSMSINDEIEHLAQVPPLGEGTGDKVFLFKCEKVTECLKPFFVTEDQQELNIGVQNVPKGQLDQRKLINAIQAEIPVLRAWLLRAFSRVPEQMADPRYGIIAWHHPELLSEINSLSPEEKLLIFLDQVWWDGEFLHGWTDKSTNMDKTLRDKHPKESERLLWGSNPFGSHLKKLIKRYPQRISKRVLNGHAIWTILPPLKTEEQNNGD